MKWSVWCLYFSLDVTLKVDTNCIVFKSETNWYILVAPGSPFCILPMQKLFGSFVIQKPHHSLIWCMFWVWWCYGMVPFGPRYVAQRLRIDMDKPDNKTDVPFCHDDVRCHLCSSCATCSTPWNNSKNWLHVFSKIQTLQEKNCNEKKCHIEFHYFTILKIWNRSYCLTDM